MRSEKLWRVWWLWGIPVAWAASALILSAEYTRNAGFQGWGNALDVARLALYWSWMRVAWACSGNVERSFWGPLSRIGLLLGLAANAFV
jgi:hypothetical protein